MQDKMFSLNEAKYTDESLNLDFILRDKDPYKFYLDKLLEVQRNGNTVCLGYYLGISKDNSKLVLSPVVVRETIFAKNLFNQDRFFSYRFENFPAFIENFQIDLFPIREEYLKELVRNSQTHINVIRDKQ